MAASSAAALSTSAVTYSGTSIVDPAGGIVWRIDGNSTSWTIYSEAASFYIGNPNANGVRTSTSAAGTDYQWTFASTASSAFMIRNKATTARMLRYNSQNPRFACYTTGQNPIRLYKMAFLEWQTGMSSAFAYIVLIVVVAISNIYVKYLNKAKAR